MMTDNITPYKDIWPNIHASVFIAPTANVIGNVEIGKNTNIWYGCILRGDMNVIRIGEGVNIQDLTVVHVDSQKYGTFIGNNVTIGHSAIIHACRLQDRCFVGMQACVMDGAIIETGAMVAAGSLVPPGKIVKANQLWAGTPARFVRQCAEQENSMIERIPREYADMAKEYLKIGIGVVNKK